MLLALRQLVAGVCLAATLASPAGMVSPSVSSGPYVDVGAGHSYAESIQVATEDGIMSGVGGGRFQPSREVTGHELAIMLCRMNGLDATWLSCYGVARAEGYYDARMAEYATSAIPYELARTAICRAAGIEGDYGDVKDPDVGMTRAEAAHALVRARLWGELGIEVVPEEGYEGIALATRDRMMLELPVEILEAMAHNKWSVDAGGTYIKNYMVKNADKGYSSVIGLCSFGSRTIHVTTPGAILHETGHFWSRVMCQSRDAEALFKSESVPGKKILGSYSTTNSMEFMAEAFRYYVEGRDDEAAMAAMREAMPRTYETFVHREAHGWVPEV